jgi:hypothetical protein
MSGYLLDNYPSGSTIYALWNTYDSAGSSVTMTGLAVTDIEIYKNGGTSQRSSDNGYTLLDTDGIDFDTLTGIHGISIDLSDNSDSGFYAVGSQYTVIIATVTIDSQTVRFILGSFRIVAAEATAGYPVVTSKVGTGTGEINLSSGVVPANVTQFGGTNGTFASGRPEVNTTLIEGSDATNQIRDAVVDDATRIDASALNTLSSHDPGETIMGATDLGTGSGLTSLASAANLATVAGYIDTEIGAIQSDLTAVKAKTDNLPSDPADASVVAGLIAAVDAKVDIIDTNVDAILVDTGTTLDGKIDTLDTVADAIKAKTDSLTFTQAGHVDANIQRINDVAVTGDGQPGTEFGV